MATRQAKVGTQGSNDFTATFDSNILAGSIVAVYFTVGNQSGNPTSIVDTITGTTTYTQVDTINDSVATDERAFTYWGAPAAGGACTVTVNFGATPTDGILIIAELTGRDTAAPVGTRHGSNTQATPGTGANGVNSGLTSITALSGDDVHHVMFDVGALRTGNYTAGTGFT